MKACVLSIGTELTVGQIVNRNSQWISQRLKESGVETSVHLTVPDERLAILRALSYLEPQTQLLIVTGGLGPTSDDFTRNIISEWAQTDLIYHEESWEHICSLLTSRGVPLRESQKNQCYFPKNSQVLFNERGTANGFYLQVRGVDVFVLPGPPREIEAIWKNSVSHWLNLKASTLDPLLVSSWDTMGLGEAEIAHLTEEALGTSGYERGYRVHLPYVEVKVSYLKSQTAAAHPFVHAVEKALAPYTWLRNGESATRAFSNQISQLSELEIIDEVTQGFLWTRMKEVNLIFSNKMKFAMSNQAAIESQFKNQIHVKPSGFNTIEIWLKLGTQKKVFYVQSPYTLPTLLERRLQYFSELVLITVAKSLSL